MNRIIIRDMKATSIIAVIILLSLGISHFPAYAKINTDVNNKSYSEQHRILDFFSTDYQTARNKFLTAANNNSGRVMTYRHPLTDPNGNALFLDVVKFGTREPKTLLVISSGTHGIEGFAGSAIQTGLLQTKIADHLPPNLGLVLIHAINPYGFAYLRRFNEENIDINRNFIDHSLPHPKNENYIQLANAINPKSLSWWSNTVSLIHLLSYRFWYGKDQIRSAISKGQYSHPQGLFYGGNSAAWSNHTIRQIAADHLSHSKQVIFIDIHTGLGSYGNPEIIIHSKKDTPSYQQANKWWGDIVTSSVSGDSVSPELYGEMKDALKQMLPQSKLTAVSLEFGTVSRLKVLWALRAENWLYHYGGENTPNEKEIKSHLLNVFYPDDKEWRLTVWQHGETIINQLLSELQHQKSQ